jgi:hypothetical protein
MERWSRLGGINSMVNAAENNGEMAEWSNAAVSKTVVPLSRNRGFESPSLRKAKINPAKEGLFILLKFRRKLAF